MDKKEELCSGGTLTKSGTSTLRHLIKKDNNVLTAVGHEELLTKLSDKTGFYKKDLTYIIKCLEELITEEALSTKKNETKSIKLFKGFSILSSYTPETEVVDIKTINNGGKAGKTIAEPTVHVNVAISHFYREKIKEQYRNLIHQGLVETVDPKDACTDTDDDSETE